MLRLSSMGCALRASWLSSLLGFSVLACGGTSGSGSSSSSSPTTTKAPDGTEVLSSLKILTPSEGGQAVYSPIIKGIKPGDDLTYCSYSGVYTQEEQFVHFIQGSQTKYGHHAIMFYTTKAEEPRTELCTGQSMETLTQLIGGVGGEGVVNFSGLPENSGTIIPKGAQFVIQTHWINTGDEVAEGQAMMATVPGPATNRVVLGTMAVVNLTFNVPALSPGAATMDCPLEHDTQVLLTLGHEHEWGTHVRADAIRASSGQDDVLFDRDFTPHDVFAPPVDTYTMDKPLELSKGDKIKLDCQWQNTTSDALTFPREMCVFFSFSLTPGDAQCVNGAWIYSGNSPYVGDGGAPPAN